jgi:hypothetical protein
MFAVFFESKYAACVLLTGVEPSTLVLNPFIDLLYQTLMTDDCGGIGEMNNWQRNRALVLSLCVPLKCLYPAVALHDVASQKTRLFSVTAA